MSGPNEPASTAPCATAAGSTLLMLTLVLVVVATVAVVLLSVAREASGNQKQWKTHCIVNILPGKSAHEAGKIFRIKSYLLLLWSGRMRSAFSHAVSAVVRGSSGFGGRKTVKSCLLMVWLEADERMLKVFSLTLSVFSPVRVDEWFVETIIRIASSWQKWWNVGWIECASG